MGKIQQELNQTLRTASVSMGAIKGAGQLDAKQRLAQERETFGVEKKNLLQRIKMANARTEELKSAAIERQELLQKHTKIGVFGQSAKKLKKILEENKDGNKE